MIGQRIRGYGVVRKLGEGGMAAVYEVFNEQTERRAALKVLHSELARIPEIGRRFLAEVRVANRVEHPGMVVCLEFVQEEAMACIIMELLRGETLGARLRRTGRLQVAEMLRLGTQIADVMVAAHDHGVVHRDIKPENVMIVGDTWVTGGERVKVLDFGIAKVRQGLAGPEALTHLKTNDGSVLGTPAYMSPEQCRGAAQLDSASDIYSLGVVLYECLGGTQPFVGDSSIAVMEQHMNATVPPLRGLQADAPSELPALIHAMLAKDSAARPTMKQVRAELERLGRTKASGSSPPPPSASQQRRQPQTEPLLPVVQDEYEAPSPRSKGAGAPLLWPVVVTLLLLGGGGVVMYRLIMGWWGSGGSHPNADLGHPPMADLSGMLEWRIYSDPSGAEVVRKEQGRETVLCKTPCTLQQGPGEERITLWYNGYFTRDLVLGREVQYSVALQPKPGKSPQGPQRRLDASAGRRDGGTGGASDETVESPDLRTEPAAPEGARGPAEMPRVELPRPPSEEPADLGPGAR